VSDHGFRRLIGNDLLSKPTAHLAGVSPSSVRSSGKASSASPTPIDSVAARSTKLAANPSSQLPGVVEMATELLFMLAISTIVDAGNSYRDEPAGDAA
jgi:hypothetical protein